MNGMTSHPIAFWFRRDFRLHDNQGLYHALKTGRPVLPVFIFDRDILDDLADRDDARVTFIHREIEAIDGQFRKLGASLLVRYGKPIEVWKDIAQTYNPEAVYTNRDYEPYAKGRDSSVAGMLRSQGIGFESFKDQVIHEGSEVLKDDGNAYHVFTPYSKRWIERLTPTHFSVYPSAMGYTNWFRHNEGAIPSLEAMGYNQSTINILPREVPDELLTQYADRRNIPGVEGTSRLSVHLRFGTISLRELAARAHKLSPVFLNELIWREFYMMLLDRYPRLVTENFRTGYDRIPWRNNPEEFDRWCAGQTGVPLIDAGMRQLRATGYMHNRVRMVVASFLCKNLLIDWRWGEAWFARYLLDYELSSNNGGWQWAAGTGTDAAPYFRVFNPVSQQVRFDPDFTYIRQWVPEFSTPAYPSGPMVDLKESRQRAIQVFGAVQK